MIAGARRRSEAARSRAATLSELSPDGADYDASLGGEEFAMIESRTSGSSIVLVLVLNALAGMGERRR